MKRHAPALDFLFEPDVLESRLPSNQVQVLSARIMRRLSQRHLIK
jgi:hypothetical protein